MSGKGTHRKLIKSNETSIDRTKIMLRRLSMQTPEKTNINQNLLRSITSNSKSKVSYAYKERFCGIYEDKRRNGKLTKENSFDKFVNPTGEIKVGYENHLQQAHNFVAFDQVMKD